MRSSGLYERSFSWRTLKTSPWERWVQAYKSSSLIQWRPKTTNILFFSTVYCFSICLIILIIAMCNLFNVIRISNYNNDVIQAYCVFLDVMFLSVFCLWSVCDALLLHLICNSSLFWTQGAKSRWCICCCEISRDVEQREQPERSSHWLWPLLTAARLSTAQNRWATGKRPHAAVKVHFSICRLFLCYVIMIKCFYIKPTKYICTKGISYVYNWKL